MRILVKLHAEANPGCKRKYLAHNRGTGVCLQANAMSDLPGGALRFLPAVWRIFCCSCIGRTAGFAGWSAHPPLRYDVLSPKIYRWRDFVARFPLITIANTQKSVSQVNLPTPRFAYHSRRGCGRGRAAVVDRKARRATKTLAFSRLPLSLPVTSELQVLNTCTSSIKQLVVMRIYGCCC
jgi:hypothetical protein